MPSVTTTFTTPTLPELSLGKRGFGDSAQRLLILTTGIVLVLVLVCALLFATLGTATDVVTVSGTVVPSGMVDVVATEPGEIVAVRVSNGSRVAPGDTLLLLSSDQLSDQVRQLQIVVEEQRALLRVAGADSTAERGRRESRVNAARLRLQSSEAALRDRMVMFGIANNVDSILRAHVAGRHVELDRVVTDHRLAEIELRAAEFDAAQAPSASAEVERARIALSRAIQNVELAVERTRRLAITARTEGVITSDGVERLLGTFVQPGQKVLEIADDRRFMVEAELTESEVERVDLGSDVVLELTAFAGEDNREVLGSVQSISVAPVSTSVGGPAARAFKARIGLAEPRPGDVDLARVRPGYTVRARIAGRETGLARRVWRRLVAGRARVS